MIVVAEGDLPLNRLVLGHLLARVPASEVALTAADPRAVDDIADLGVEVRPAHPDDPAAAARSFREGDLVLVSSRFGGTGLLNAALGADIARVVLVGKVAPGTTRMKWHHLHEGSVRRSGVPFTLLRKNVDSEDFAPAARLALRSGEFVSSFDGGVVAPAARTDYAEAAAVVLTDAGHEGRAYDITGPLGLKDLGIASVFSQIAGRDIALRQVPHADLATQLVKAGASADVAAQLETLYRDIGGDEWSTAADDLERLIGHRRLSLVEALTTALGKRA
jgi:NAD(P)H dehydrogenase (quinone)